MASISVPFPRRLDIAGALKFQPTLEALPAADEYEFDFAQFAYAEPFGMLYAAAVLSEFVDQRRASISGKNFERCGYQSHMGFFHSLGIDHGNKPGEASGGSNYLPITSVDIEGLRDEAHRQGLQTGDIVLQDAERMAERLLRTNKGRLFDALAYSLREIIRNVVEHSDATTVKFCLQHWPSKNRVHLAILDQGMGVRKSLQANPHLEMKSDLDALRLAIKPGVSGKMFEGVESNADDRWENSGYGLFLTSRLSAASGNFWIFSGTAALALMGEGQQKYDCSFQGTAIRISLDTRKMEDTKSLIKKLTVAGERDQSSKSASAGSKIVSSQS